MPDRDEPVIPASDVSKTVVAFARDCRELRQQVKRLEVQVAGLVDDNASLEHVRLHLEGEVERLERDLETLAAAHVGLTELWRSDRARLKRVHERPVVVPYHGMRSNGTPDPCMGAGG